MIAELEKLLSKTKQIVAEWVAEPWRTILVSKQPLMIALRWCLLILWLSIPMFSFRRIVYSLLPAAFYQRDLIQEYLLAKALFTGENLYLPLTELAKRLTPDLPVAIFSHPTPHPPLVALLFLPLALLTYEQAIVAWFVLELLCVVMVSYLIAGWLGKGRNWKWIVMLSLIIIAWEPYVTDIALGQLSFFLLLLLSGAWLCLRENRDVLGGFLLGLVLALKLMAWPIVIYLVLRKRWRAVAAVGALVVVSNVIMGGMIGFDNLFDYYFSIGPAASTTYRGDGWNLSVYSMGWRLFCGANSQIDSLFCVPPLRDVLSPFAPYAAILFSALLTLVGLYFAMRSNAFDIAFGILVCASILVNPVAWIHYFTWLLIPMAVLGRYLYKFSFPHLESLWAFISFFILVYLLSFVSYLAHFLVQLTAKHVPVNLVELLLYLPVFGVLILMGTLIRIDRRLSTKFCGVPQKLNKVDH